MSSGHSWDQVQDAVERLLERLDWQALGEIYFHWGGEKFWQERRDRVRSLGMPLAKALMRRLSPGGDSLWAGAGVEELPMVLAETMLRGRHARPVSKRGDEVQVLNDGLKAAGLVGVVEYECADAGAVAAQRPGGFDHLGCISLFTDPETWPLLSDVAYGRIAPVQIDVEAFVRERQEAEALAGKLFSGLARPALVTTTAEEVAWFLAQAEAAGCRYDAEDELMETAVVGDAVGFVRIG